MTRASKSRVYLFRAVLWSVVLSIGSEILPADDKPAVPPLPTWKANLQSEEVETRRLAAIATRSADRPLQKQLLPILVELLMTEKDGQVRLAVLDTLTDMGPASEPAIPALVKGMRTNHGGRRNEELHQDYRAALALAAIGEPAVEELCGLLKEEKLNIRAEAAMALGRIGPRATAAIPRLLELLADEQARVRREAALALGRIGEPAIDPLLAEASRKEVSHRVGAIAALGQLPAPDDRAASAIVDATHDTEATVRAAAVKSLTSLNLSPEVEKKVLLENLRHHDENVRAAVVNRLMQERELLHEIKAELSELLVAQHDGVAWHAAFLLRHCGLDSAPTLLTALQQEGSRIEQIGQALALFGSPARDLLAQAIDDGDPRVRQGAALALGQIRPLSDATVGKLAAGLNDEDRDVQSACLTAIGYLGSRAGSAVPDVRRKLQDESPEIRQQAIGILFTAAPRDAALLDDLISKLNDHDEGVQRRAIDAIRSLGPLGRRAISVVVEKLESPDNDVRMAAASMIGSHGAAAAEAVPALRALLDDASPELRTVGAQTLGQLGTAARPAFPTLVELLDDAHVGVRAEVVRTVGNLDLEPEQIRPQLAKALRDEESDVRRAAFRGIRKFGRRGTIFLPDLILLAANVEQGRFVRRALSRYERYGPDPRSVPELIQHLQHEHEAVRQLAAKFLGLAGPGASDAVPELERLAADPSEEVRAEARTAIAKIQQTPPTGPSDSDNEEASP